MIHLVLGKQGSGKTLFLVAKAYEFHLKGKTIYSNVHLTFPYKTLDYDDIINCRLNDCMVLLDEIHLLLPARGSGSNPVSKEICDGFVSQIRKAGVELYGSTQTAKKVDVRIRDEMDFAYFCERYQFIGNHWEKIPHPYPIDKDIPMIINLEVVEEVSRKIINSPFIANTYYGMYDSKQRVLIRGLEEAIESKKNKGKKGVGKKEKKEKKKKKKKKKGKKK